VALLSHPPHNFVRQPHRYYRLQEVANYATVVAFNGMTAISNFVKIHPTNGHAGVVSYAGDVSGM
jgi:hypothetical protein